MDGYWINIEGYVNLPTYHKLPRYVLSSRIWEMKLRITKLFILTIIFQVTIGGSKNKLLLTEFKIIYFKYKHFLEQFVVEDGPYGGNGGISWTDGSGVNLNGDITAMEIRSHSRVDAIRVR